MMSTPTRDKSVDIRLKVCAIARTWLRTPYHHMGRVRGAGVDCAMFPLEVYREAGLMPAIDVPYYPIDWHLHRSEEIYLGIVLKYARELQGTGDREQGTVKPERGDFVLYKHGRCWAHGAIVLEWPLMIHSVMGLGVILADGERDGQVLGRKRRFFTLFPE